MKGCLEFSRVSTPFERILNQLEEHKAIVYSKAHDFDMDWAVPDSIERSLREVGSPEKIAAYGGAAGIRAEL